MECGHETIPPLRSGVLSIALMVEYRLYNEAVAYDGYKNCFGCWIQQSDFVDLYPDVTELYLKNM